MVAKNIILGTLLLIAVLMRFIGGDIAILGYFVLACHAFFGRIQLIQSLALLWFFSFIGGAIAPAVTGASIARYITVGGATISLLLLNYQDRAFKSISLPVLATFLLGAFIFIHSMLFSEVLDVSLLKIILWVSVMVVLLSAWKGLDYLERTRLERQLFGGLVVVMLVSLPLVITKIGYINNGYGFQGILNQSQAFGITMVLLASWLIGRLFETVRYRWLNIILLGICLVLMIMSETRTAGFSLFLAALGVSIIFFFTKFSIKSTMRALAVMPIIIMIGYGMNDQLKTFIYKRNNAVNLVEMGVESRSILVIPMIANISENPMSGIGFGVGSRPVDREWIDRENIFGLPTSAAIEKGLMPVAVLEELGVPGLLVVFAWLWMTIRRAHRSGVTPFLVVSTLMFTNLGEAALFSTGGMGLFFLILIAWAATGRGYVLEGLAVKPNLRTVLMQQRLLTSKVV